MVVAEDDDMSFAVLLNAYIIAREGEDEQQPQPQRARRAAEQAVLGANMAHRGEEATFWTVLQPPRKRLEV